MELKFRAWNNELKTMADSENIGGALGSLLIATNYQGIEQLTFMQYTGLKDKNDQEIYEDDVIVNHWNGHQQKLLVVNSAPLIDETGWLKSRGGLSFEILSGEKMKYQLHPDCFEVIGNKYQNPELLEVEK